MTTWEARPCSANGVGCSARIEKLEGEPCFGGGALSVELFFNLQTQSKLSVPFLVGDLSASFGQPSDRSLTRLVANLGPYVGAWSFGSRSNGGYAQFKVQLRPEQIRELDEKRTLGGDVVLIFKFSVFVHESSDPMVLRPEIHVPLNQSAWLNVLKQMEW